MEEKKYERHKIQRAMAKKIQKRYENGEYSKERRKELLMQMQSKLDEIFVNGAVTISASDYAAMARRAGSIISPRLSPTLAPARAVPAAEISPQKPESVSIDSVSFPSSGSLLSENSSCTSKHLWEDDAGGDAVESDGSDQPFATNIPLPPPIISETEDFPQVEPVTDKKLKSGPMGENSFAAKYLKKFDVFYLEKGVFVDSSGSSQTTVHVKDGKLWKKGMHGPFKSILPRYFRLKLHLGDMLNPARGELIYYANKGDSHSKGSVVIDHCSVLLTLNDEFEDPSDLPSHVPGELPPNSKWQHRTGKDSWTDYNDEHSKLLTEAYQSGVEMVSLSGDMDGKLTTWTVNLAFMEQRRDNVPSKKSAVRCFNGDLTASPLKRKLIKSSKSRAGSEFGLDATREKKIRGHGKMGGFSITTVENIILHCFTGDEAECHEWQREIQNVLDYLKEYNQACMLMDNAGDSPFADAVKPVMRKGSIMKRNSIMIADDSLMFSRAIEAVLNVERKCLDASSWGMKAEVVLPNRKGLIEIEEKGSSIMFSDTDNLSLRVKSYEPRVFGELRKRDNISHTSFKRSMMKLYNPGEMTGGSSGADFYFTSDDKYICKEIKKREEMDVLLKILHSFAQYCEENPHTLLPPLYGLYEIFYKGRKFRVVVMMNINHTKLKIHKTFDLKGSTVNRESGGGSVLKDTDFTRMKCGLNFGAHREVILKQLEDDTKFLAGHNIMDYSLLVGIHNDPNLEIPVADDEWLRRRCWDKTALEDNWRKFQGGFVSVCRTKVYFLGIIDIFQVYNLQKKLEKRLKTAKIKVTHLGSKADTDISSTNSAHYRQRFNDFMRRAVFPKQKLVIFPTGKSQRDFLLSCLKNRHLLEAHMDANNMHLDPDELVTTKSSGTNNRSQHMTPRIQTSQSARAAPNNAFRKIQNQRRSVRLTNTGKLLQRAASAPSNAPDGRMRRKSMDL